MCHTAKEDTSIHLPSTGASGDKDGGGVRKEKCLPIPKSLSMNNKTRWC